MSFFNQLLQVHSLSLIQNYKMIKQVYMQVDIIIIIIIIIIIYSFESFSNQR